MRQLSLHLLDLAENSTAAGATAVAIEVVEDLRTDRMRLVINDNGKGMDEETVEKVVDPFITSRTERNVGLGIPLLKEAAESSNGKLAIYSTPGKGTRVEVEFQRSHIDRMPLGDLSGTFYCLLIGHPLVNWSFNYRAISKDGNLVNEFEFDDRPIKDTLGDLPLSDPDVVGYLRDWINTGVDEVQRSLPQPEWL